MIVVTRLNGSEIVINTDLIETIEATPDTVLTLVDGKKYVVHESAGEVVDRIRSYRVSLLRSLDEPVQGPSADIYVLPPVDEDRG